MGFHTNMTIAEKIAHLEGVVFALHQSIYSSCSVSDINIEDIDLNNSSSWSTLVLDEANLSRPDWMARNTIVRDIQKLNIVNKKLEELRNA